MLGILHGHTNALPFHLFQNTERLFGSAHTVVHPRKEVAVTIGHALQDTFRRYGYVSGERPHKKLFTAMIVRTVVIAVTVTVTTVGTFGSIQNHGKILETLFAINIFQFGKHGAFQ